MHEVVGLKNKDVVQLKRKIVNQIVPFSSDDRLQLRQNFSIDFRNSDFLKAAVALTLKQRFSYVDVLFTFLLYQEGDDRFKAETSLQRLTNLSDFEVHKIVEAALLGVAGI